jgi:hypothetical protein
MKRTIMFCSAVVCSIVGRARPEIATRHLAVLLALVGLCLGGLMGTAAAKPNHKPTISFDMVVSRGAATCLPHARGHLKITSLGPVEEMEVEVEGLPPHTNFDFFVIQLPKAPFGLSWYQGDIDTDDDGEGSGRFIGRFSIETFVVAPGSGPAPVVFNEAFPDAAINPSTNPVQTYHLGLWFNSPDDAKAAGCPATVTPFNGEHNAGIQVLNTSNFPDLAGPLRQLDTTAGE